MEGGLWTFVYWLVRGFVCLFLAGGSYIAGDGSILGRSEAMRWMRTESAFQQSIFKGGRKRELGDREKFDIWTILSRTLSNLQLYAILALL